MKCPKCGYSRQPSDNTFAPATECPACGVVYAKTTAEGTASPLAAGTVKRASPVNEETLKRARERVEMKLRKQLKSSVDDERRQQTLQRAKILATDGVRQRQEEWKRKQVAKKGEPDDLTMSEAAIRVKDPTANLDAFKGGALTMFGVIRPETTVPEGEDGDTDASGLKIASSVSLSDSLANRPPGEDLAYDTHSTDPAAPDASPPRRTADHAAATKTEPANIKIASRKKKAAKKEVRRIKEETAAVTDSADASPDEPQDTPHEDQIGGSAPEDNVHVVDRKAPVSPNDDQPEVPAHIAQTAVARPGNGLFRLLPTVAWIILAAGLVGAVLSWTTLNNVQAGVEETAAVASGAIPIALLLGFAYLATGVLGFAFFWVCSMISGQLRHIQQTLDTQARGWD